MFNLLKVLSLSLIPIFISISSLAAKTNQISSTQQNLNGSTNPKSSKWLTQPYFHFTDYDLQFKNRGFEVELIRDAKGYIEQLKIIQGTGIKDLDEKIIAAFRDSRLDPQKMPKKITLSIILTQQFAEVKSQKVKIRQGMSDQDIEKIWQYFPALNYTNEDLEGQNRQLEIRIHFDAKGKAKSIKILNSSGIKSLDQKMASQIRTALLYPVHAPIALNIPLQLNLKK